MSVQRTLTIFNLVRTLQSHPDILKRVLDLMKEQDLEGVLAALLQVRRAVTLLFAEMTVHGAIVAETDAAIAKWGE